MSWRIWNLSLTWSPPNMLLFIGVILWNVERILYNTYQSLTQGAAEILISILNNPFEDSMFHTRWSESLEILTHRGTNSLKKNSHSPTPNQNVNLLSQRHPSEVFFSYPNQKSSYNEMILKLQSIYVSSLQWILWICLYQTNSKMHSPNQLRRVQTQGLLSEKKMKGSCVGIFSFLHLI